MPPSSSRRPFRNADTVLDYLLTHPGFLESFVIGPQISAETFQRWTLKRNNKLRRDSRRQLLSGFAVQNLNFLIFKNLIAIYRRRLVARTFARCWPTTWPTGIGCSTSWP
jgi:hypothetical protein